MCNIQAQAPVLQLGDIILCCLFMARDSGTSTPAGAGSSTASSSLSSQTFTLQAAAVSSSSGVRSTSGKAGRRLYVASEVLRACKISASDPLLVAGVLSAAELKRRLSLQTKDQVEKKARLCSQHVPSA